MILNNYIIYKHTHKQSGKGYIGLTNNINKRDKAHQSPKSGCSSFKNAVQKYGWDAFSHEVLLEHLTLDEANLKEQEYINTHNTLSPYGYNLTSGGKHCLLSDESKQKISKANKGKDKPPRTKEHCLSMSISKTGNVLTEEHKKNISNTLIGQPKSDKHKQNISLGRIGKPSNRKGQPCSTEHKMKLSTSAKQLPTSTCPHCGHIGKGNSMKRWHFDNCKHNLKLEHTVYN
jgi:group I intron endonuclease